MTVWCVLQEEEKVYIIRSSPIPYNVWSICVMSSVWPFLWIDPSTLNGEAGWADTVDLCLTPVSYQQLQDCHNWTWHRQHFPATTYSTHPHSLSPIRCWRSPPGLTLDFLMQWCHGEGQYVHTACHSTQTCMGSALLWGQGSPSCQARQTAWSVTAWKTLGF